MQALWIQELARACRGLDALLMGLSRKLRFGWKGRFFEPHSPTRRFGPGACCGARGPNFAGSPLVGLAKSAKRRPKNKQRLHGTSIAPLSHAIRFVLHVTLAIFDGHITPHFAAYWFQPHARRAKKQCSDSLDIPWWGIAPDCYSIYEVIG